MGAPTIARVGVAKGGDIFRLTIDDGEPIQMAAVLGGESSDERRPPARHETVVRIERAKAREAGVDDPEFPLTPVPSPPRGEGGLCPGHFMYGNVARDVAGAWQKAGVV